MPYRFSDKYSTADAGIIVTGRTVEELFCDAALGMTEILVDLEDLESGRQLMVKKKTMSSLAEGQKCEVCFNPAVDFVDGKWVCGGECRDKAYKELRRRVRRIQSGLPK